VTPEPPVRAVKSEQISARTTAVPPGSQPKHARKTRSSRSDERPAASAKPPA
jgi:hypothetical protein